MPKRTKSDAISEEAQRRPEQIPAKIQFTGSNMDDALKKIESKKSLGAHGSHQSSHEKIIKPNGLKNRKFDGEKPAKGKNTKKTTNLTKNDTGISRRIKNDHELININNGDYYVNQQFAEGNLDEEEAYPYQHI